jgi:N-acetylmuramoyl-L-alanine amidase
LTLSSVYLIAVRNDIIRRIQRVFTLIGFIALLGILLIVANMLEYTPWSPGSAGSGNDTNRIDRRVGLISGHAGFDSGAICEDELGKVTLTEAEVVAEITKLAAKQLRRHGYDVLVLEEYDHQLTGLQAAVLLSLHADSCLFASGYKAAYYVRSQTPMAGDRILDCINRHYAGETGLVEDRNTITTDMTEYHAFRKVDQNTPAAILELGYLGGDRVLLTENPEVAAKGVADSLLCFLNQ